MAEKKIEMFNIYQKLSKIRKQVEVIQKNRSGYGYKYVSEDEILAKVTGLMDKYGLSLIPAIVPGTSVVTPYHSKKTKIAKDGTIYEENINEVLVSADMLFSWVNNESPEERVEVPWVVVGHQNDGSQSLGSGLSYSMRYFLLKFFNIATPDDDPDKWRSKQREAAAAEDKTIAEQIVQTIDRTVRTFLQADPGKSEEVKAFISRYVKGGNYLAIKESAVASKLLSDFRKQFNIKIEEE